MRHLQLVPKTLNIGTSAFNDSVPEARDGTRIIREAKDLMRLGLTLKQAGERLAQKYGKLECVLAVSRAVGLDDLAGHVSDPMKSPLDARDLVVFAPIPPEVRSLHQKAGRDAQVCLGCGEPFSILVLKCPRCGRSV